MKIAFLANTPYQLLNAINIAAGIFNLHEDKIDLFFQRDRMRDPEISERLKKSGFFSNVYAYIPEKDSSTAAKIWHRILSIIAPEREIKKSLVYGHFRTIPRYDIVFLTTSIHFARILRYASKAKHVYYFEDGTGNYSPTEQLLNVVPLSLRILYFLTGKRIKKMKPEKMYVYRSDLCRNSLTEDIQAIPLLSSQEKIFTDKLKDIFGMPESAPYAGKKIIYLTSVNDTNTPCFESCMIKTLQILKGYSSTTVVRPHPRYIPDCLSGFDVDRSKCLWELLCAETITENTILISECSTAQQTPKILFNKEPYLIYTLNLNEYQKNNPAYDCIIDGVRSIYKDKSKIAVPETWEDFSVILAKILHRIQETQEKELQSR